MTVFRIGDAAGVLGVSPDTVRRWVDRGKLVAERDAKGHRLIPGAELASFAHDLWDDTGEGYERSSARNRLRGIITAIATDSVMAKVTMPARSGSSR